VGTRNNELQRFFMGDLGELIVYVKPKQNQTPSVEKLALD
jgi:hypothetical protein